MCAVRIPYSECKQFFAALVLSHGLIVEVILPDVHFHLYLFQVQQEVKSMRVRLHL